MSERTMRLAAIKEIISGGRIENQEELISRLEERGFSLTQGALSKDLKSLSVYKVTDEKGYCYAIPRSSASTTAGLGGFVTDIVFSGNLMVVKTLAGHAGAVAAAMDGMRMDGMLGSIAGDDTIFAALSADADRDALRDKMEKSFCNKGG